MSWQPIETMPKEDLECFLVLIPDFDLTEYLVLQVSVFQHDMYPDHLKGNIDYADRVLEATHWMPRPSLP